VIENFVKWLDGVSQLPPEFVGAILAMLLSLLRVVYDEQETKPIRVLVETLICGGLSLTASSAIIAMNLDSNWAMFVGGSIGFLGVTTVRALALKLINKKI